MKKLICILAAFTILFSLASCGSEPQPEPAQASASSGEKKVDVDLTALSSTMVYSEVYNMMTKPEDYEGKTVKMNGTFAAYEGEIRDYYFACVISDATACCSQGLEFLLADGRKFPEEYPDTGSEITVVGVFETYKEGEQQYCQLKDAELI